MKGYYTPSVPMRLCELAILKYRLSENDQQWMTKRLSITLVLTHINISQYMLLFSNRAFT